MNPIMEKLQDVRNQTEDLEKRYLRESGWTYTCKFCFWLWSKTFPANSVLKREETTFLCGQSTAMAIQQCEDALNSEESD